MGWGNLTLKGSRVWRCHGPGGGLMSGGGVMAIKSNVELLDGSIITECTVGDRVGGMRAGLVAHVCTEPAPPSEVFRKNLPL